MAANGKRITSLQISDDVVTALDRASKQYGITKSRIADDGIRSRIEELDALFSTGEPVEIGLESENDTI